MSRMCSNETDKNTARSEGLGYNERSLERARVATARLAVIRFEPICFCNWQFGRTRPFHSSYAAV